MNTSTSEKSPPYAGLTAHAVPSYKASASSLSHPAAALCPDERALPSPWFVCLTKPRQEAYAAARLAEQGYELYLPFLSCWSRRSGQWNRKEVVMFPRYVFVRPGAPGQGVWPVRSTPGVTALVKFGPIIAQLSSERLCALRKLVEEQACAAPAEPLQAGQQVLFAKGPLQGLGGIVSRVSSERVSVLMTLLGQHQTVSAPIHQLMLA